ncbi:MAG: 30S ribosomal protein S27ae [Methanobacteriota archaeon]|nr:MAG: 30S ribosomal protein S27ae [Euryarchaeota archaeon]
MSKIEFYDVSDGKLKRKREHCPECGPGTFMAHHADRKSCGRCGHTVPAAGSAPAEASAPAADTPAGSDDSAAGDSGSD